MKVIAAAEMEIEDMRYGMRMLQSGSASPDCPTALPPAGADGAPRLPAAKAESAKTIIEQGVIADAARREVNVAKALLLAEELLEKEDGGRETFHLRRRVPWLKDRFDAANPRRHSAVSL